MGSPGKLSLGTQEQNRAGNSFKDTFVRAQGLCPHSGYKVMQKQEETSMAEQGSAVQTEGKEGKGKSISSGSRDGCPGKNTEMLPIHAEMGSRKLLTEMELNLMGDVKNN